MTAEAVSAFNTRAVAAIIQVDPKVPHSQVSVNDDRASAVQVLESPSNFRQPGQALVHVVLACELNASLASNTATQRTCLCGGGGRQGRSEGEERD